ncbi:hypothetical protein RIF29_12713 [Crotalaria pallida]|uniref:Uncharacterized protein n=1 Tax=Crotalaria pallida TaxID=3830 RepID=A0AAN9P1B7_CROPI
MDIMTTMHYFPEFSDAVDEGFKLPSQFCGGAANTMPLADLINNNNPPVPWSSSSFTNSPFTTISFTNNNSTTQMLQQQEQTPPAMFSNSIKQSWKPTNMSEATNPCGKLLAHTRVYHLIL